MPDPWKGWAPKAPQYPTLESFKPPKVKLRAVGKTIHQGGIVRARATLDTKSGKNPKHGYLTGLAQKTSTRPHGYLLKDVKAKRKAAKGG